MPDSIMIVMFTYVPLRSADGLERLLAAFESTEDTTPTQWGPDARTRHVFQHQEMVNAIAAYKNDMYSPCVARRKALRYQAFFTAKNNGLCKVQIEFASPRDKEAAAVFAMGTALAQNLQAELGFVHPVWQLGDTSQHYSASGVLSLAELQQFGLNPICARTWYGQYLADKIGEHLLSSCVSSAVSTTWGGIQLDLVPEPWKAGFETLKAHQNSAMECLFPSGVYADYSEFANFKPGVRWEPMP